MNQNIEEIKASIIIPTYDRPNTLKKVIDSYINQTGIGELIIIDDNSIKSYSEINRYIKKKLYNKKINYIYHKNNKNMGAAYCRNKGVELANYGYILWGEDDAFLSNEYLKVLIEKVKNELTLKNKRSIYFGSIYYGITPFSTSQEKNQIIKNQQNTNKPIFDYDLFEGYYRKNIKSDLDVPFGHSLLLAPKEAYSGIGYFENYKVNGYREESDAQVLMVKNGYRIIYTSDTQCYHLPGSEIENGGQHKSSKIKQELYKIINTAIFYDRHYSFLKRNYHLKKSKFVLKIIFSKKIISFVIKKIYKKIKRK